MISIKDSVSVLIVAAETSSTLYAQRLLESWKLNKVPIKAFGIGSREMEKLGFEIVGRSEDLAVVGVQEVIAHWPVIKGAFHGLLTMAQERQPKVAILLDYPDFNLRLAKKLKALGIRVVYYISPQVWAWRQSRVHLIKKVVDRMLVLLPFEVDFYKKFDVPVEFVGHPLLDEINDELTSPQEVQFRRGKFGLRPEDVVLALMPGSRRSELKHHLEVQIRAAEQLSARIPELKVILLTAPQFTPDFLKQQLPQTHLSLNVIQDEPFKMIGVSDVVLCASGTATLMVGMMKKPMVIMYKMNAFSAWIAKTFVRSTAHFGLINLVLGERVVEELFQEKADANGLVKALSPLLQNPQLRESIANRLGECHHRLGSKGATERVSKIIQDYCFGDCK